MFFSLFRAYILLILYKKFLQLIEHCKTLRFSGANEVISTFCAA